MTKTEWSAFSGACGAWTGTKDLRHCLNNAGTTICTHNARPNSNYCAQCCTLLDRSLDFRLFGVEP